MDHGERPEPGRCQHQLCFLIDNAVWGRRRHVRFGSASRDSHVDCGRVRVHTLSGGSGGPVATHWGSEIAKEALVVAGTDRSNVPLGPKYGPLLALFAPAKDLYGASGSAADQYTVPEAVKCNPRCPPAGDSFAAPFVAGVAATYLERHPRATPAEVKRAIVAAATPGIVKADSSGEPNRFLYSRLSQ